MTLEKFIRRGSEMRAFVSYSRRDEKLTDEVCRQLQDRGHEVWRDVTSIPGGEVWRASIEKGIRDSDVFVLLLSPAVVERPDYAGEELAYARSLGKLIIPVYLEPVPELPNGFSLTLSLRQRVNLYPSFSSGIERLLEKLADGDAALPREPVPAERRKLELRGWASDNVGRMKAGARRLRLESKQRDLGKKALKVGGVVAAGVAAAAVASAKAKADAQKQAEARQAADSDAALVAYRRKIDDVLKRCTTELGRLVNAPDAQTAYEREFRPVLQRLLGQLDATEPPTRMVPDHRQLVENLNDTLDHLDEAFLELGRGDDERARRALERMAEQFLRTLQQYGALLAN